MKVNANEISFYKDQNYTFKSRTSKIVGKQKYIIETYEKEYSIKDIPKLFFAALKDTFKAPLNSKWAETGEDWRAVFTGKKIISLEIPQLPRIPMAPFKKLDSIVDPTLQLPVIQLRRYAHMGVELGKENHDNLTEEEIKILGFLGRKKLDHLLAFLETDLKRIFQSQFEEKLAEHKELRWNGYEDENVKFSYSIPKKGKTSGYTFEINCEEKENSVVLNGEEYDMPPDLMHRIIHGYLCSCLLDVDDLELKTEILKKNNSDLQTLFTVKLKKF